MDHGSLGLALQRLATRHLTRRAALRGSAGLAAAIGLAGPPGPRRRRLYPPGQFLSSPIA